MKLVDLPLGKVLYESGDALLHVYFPTDSIVSLLYVMESGASAEISVVGNEGLIGIAVFMGGESTPAGRSSRAPGRHFSLSSKRLRDEFNAHADMRMLMLSLHPVAHHPNGPDRGLQPASFDRSAAVPLAAAVAGPVVEQPAGHDSGVDRQHAGCAPRGVTEAAGKLQDLGVIEYHRGKITVIDRPGSKRCAASVTPW